MHKKPLIIIPGLDSKQIMFEPLMHYMSKYFSCHYFSYSLSHTIPHIISLFNNFIKQNDVFYCVTYSFGSIILRNYAARYGAGSIERVVMLVPVNQGSELLRKIMKQGIGKKLFGTLGTDFIEHEKRYLPRTPVFETGVIAGSKPVTSSSWAINKYISRFFDTTHSDGKVKIEETKLSFMKDFTTIPENHHGVLMNNHLFKLVRLFLFTGNFHSKQSGTHY